MLSHCNLKMDPCICEPMSFQFGKGDWQQWGDFNALVAANLNYNEFPEGVTYMMKRLQPGLVMVFCGLAKNNRITILEIMTFNTMLSYTLMV